MPAREPPENLDRPVRLHEGDCAVLAHLGDAELVVHRDGRRGLQDCDGEYAISAVGCPTVSDDAVRVRHGEAGAGQERRKAQTADVCYGIHCRDVQIRVEGDARQGCELATGLIWLKKPRKGIQTGNLLKLVVSAGEKDVLTESDFRNAPRAVEPRSSAELLESMGTIPRVGLKTIRRRWGSRMGLSQTQV